MAVAAPAPRAAAAHQADPATQIAVAAAAMPFRDGVADLAVAHMSFQDVDDLRRAGRDAARVL